MEIQYVHCLERSTFVPTHVSSQWDGILLLTLSQGSVCVCVCGERLTTWIEGTAPTGRTREIKRRKREDEMKCRDRARTGGASFRRGEVGGGGLGRPGGCSSESTFPPPLQ